MFDTSFTLRSIFSLPAPDVQDRRIEQWTRIEQDIIKDFPSVKWNAAMPDLAPKIDELFDIEIPNMFVIAWNKAREVQDALNESKHLSEEVIYLELAEHSIISEHHPYVEMSIKNFPPKKIIELTVKLSMKLKGFQLKIHHGVIEEIRTGLCEAEGVIEYKELIIMEKKLEAIKLPGSIRLNDGSPTVTSAKP